MAKLEDLKQGAAARGILADCLVTVVDVKWYGSAAIELTYKDPAWKPGVLLLYRDREPSLEIVEAGRPWSFDGDGKLFRLVSEAQRIHLAYLFDPLLAIYTSIVDPLPYQIIAVYGDMLPRQPLRFLLADDPGAGIVQSRAGTVPLLKRHELSADWDPTADERLTVWEVTQHLIHCLETKGETETAALKSKIGGLAETARELAYRLYTLCERKGWAEEAGFYNSLVVAWPAISHTPKLFQ